MAEEGKAVPMRDLEAARQAYKDKDVEASKAAHRAKILGAPEKHKKSGAHLKSIVYGGLDGIITTFAVVAGAAGGGLGIDVIMILGFSSIFADAVSMGMGDALSTKAENDYIMAERKREAWEYDEDLEGEVNEMIDLYVQRGMKREDAEVAIKAMSKYRDFFIDVMMIEELELQVPGEDDNPWKDGLITFGSFVVFGVVPLLGYLCFAGTSLSEMELFIVAIVLTAIMLFVLGALKSTLTSQRWWASGLEILAMGSFTAGIAYVIGYLVEEIIASTGQTVGCA